jgi:hypothetical protein
MHKTLALLRSLFLVFIVAYTVYGLPPLWSLTRTFDEQYARCSSSLTNVTRAVWLAIAWLAIETAVGWWMAIRQSRKRAEEKAAPKLTGA